MKSIAMGDHNLGQDGRIISDEEAMKRMAPSPKVLLHPLDKVLPNEWLVAVAIRVTGRLDMLADIEKFKTQHGMPPDLLLVSRRESTNLVRYTPSIAHGALDAPEEAVPDVQKGIQVFGRDLWITTYMDDGAYLVARSPGAVIPGGWSVGDRCYFSHIDEPWFAGLPGRVIGIIEAYDAETNIILINYKGQIVEQLHTLKFGGISGVPDDEKITINEEA